MKRGLWPAMAVAAVVSTGLAGAAEPAEKAAPKLTPAERQALILKRTGGFVEKPGAIGKALVVLDLQERVAGGVSQEFADYLAQNLGLQARRETGRGEWLLALDTKRAEPGVGVVVGVADVAGLPALLVAPESRWALINVAALQTPGCERETLHKRVSKELWRAFGWVMGAGLSQFEPCLMKPITKPAELDALKAETLSPEPFNMVMLRTMNQWEIQKPQPVAYRKACQEGWAPAPTNAAQKAIWDEIKGARP